MVLVTHVYDKVLEEGQAGEGEVSQAHSSSMMQGIEPWESCFLQFWRAYIK